MSGTQTFTLPVLDLGRKNGAFPKVLWAGKKTGLVLTAIPKGGEIGGGAHKGHDQLLHFVARSGLANVSETGFEEADGDIGPSPSCGFQTFRNTGSGMPKLFTTYSPPEHAPGPEHPTKAEADANN
jgi:hypothetical protein